MDRFFNQEFCDRCGKSLKDGRIMSIYNTDCICMECKRKERENADYKTACEAEQNAVKNGNLNYHGIGLKTPKK